MEPTQTIQLSENVTTLISENMKNAKTISDELSEMQKTFETKQKELKDINTKLEGVLLAILANSNVDLKVNNAQVSDDYKTINVYKVVTAETKPVAKKAKIK